MSLFKKLRRPWWGWVKDLESWYICRRIRRRRSVKGRMMKPLSWSKKTWARCHISPYSRALFPVESSYPHIIKTSANSVSDVYDAPHSSCTSLYIISMMQHFYLHTTDILASNMFASLCHPLHQEIWFAVLYSFLPCKCRFRHGCNELHLAIHHPVLHAYLMESNDTQDLYSLSYYIPCSAWPSSRSMGCKIEVTNVRIQSWRSCPTHSEFI